MKKSEVYRLLEEKMLGYADYVDVPVKAESEPFVPIVTTSNLVAKQIGIDMKLYTGSDIYVRRNILRRLERASKVLAQYDKNLCLEVIYGYRALSIQKQLFEKYKKQLSDQYSGEELMAATHRLVAVPDVAGHPAGAAVDIQIVRNGKPLDFGTKIHEFAPDTFTFSPFISKEAWGNRQILRNTMMSVGFAPFDGEWWHFSYGDKEWARYYAKDYALYNQVDFVVSGL